MEDFRSSEKNMANGGKHDLCSDAPSFLLDELQKIQEKEGYISDDNMQEIAERFNLQPAEVFSVVSFYSFFSCKKKGAHVIRVSNCQPCVMKGSNEIIKTLENILGIKCGETTDDGKYTLEKTSCIGMCDKAPAIMVDNRLIGPVSIQDIDMIISQIKV